MGKKGWWQQIQSDDYPETITNYGDFRAVNWRPQDNINQDVISKDEPIKLQENCPKCKRTYWIDRGCYNCGYKSTYIKTSPEKKQPVLKTRKSSGAKKVYKPNKTREQFNLDIPLAHLIRYYVSTGIITGTKKYYFLFKVIL